MVPGKLVHCCGSNDDILLSFVIGGDGLPLPSAVSGAKAAGTGTRLTVEPGMGVGPTLAPELASDSLSI